jgi:REP element-mobilizing transposase RayT
MATNPSSRVAATQPVRRHHAEHLHATSDTQLLLHFVFSTKNRQRTLPYGHRDALYKYIWGIHQNLNCHLYRIGGIDDHVHILTGMPTTLAIAKYTQEIKTGSSHWLKTQAEFRRFEGWQDGYGAFTVSYRDKDSVIEYVKNQPEHHRQESFVDEY